MVGFHNYENMSMPYKKLQNLTNFSATVLTFLLFLLKTEIVGTR